MTGVYKIVCLPTGRLYVGSALDCRVRKNQHWSQLKNGVHHSRFLQRAWHKYGAHSFRFVLLEEVALAENVIAREQFYIDALHPDFNSCPAAANSAGYRHTVEAKKRMSTAKRGAKPWIAGRNHTVRSKRKMSAARKGRSSGMIGRKHAKASLNKMSAMKIGKLNANSKQVSQYTLDGHLVCVFSARAEAQRATGVHDGSIRHVLAGRAHHAGGYFWTCP